MVNCLRFPAFFCTQGAFCLKIELFGLKTCNHWRFCVTADSDALKTKGRMGRAKRFETNFTHPQIPPRNWSKQPFRFTMMGGGFFSMG